MLDACVCSRARTPSIPPSECSVAQPPRHFTSPPLRCPTAQASHNHHTIKPSRYHENAGDITSMKPFPGRDRGAARSREKVWMLLRDSGRDRGQGWDLGIPRHFAVSVDVRCHAQVLSPRRTAISLKLVHHAVWTSTHTTQCKPMPAESTRQLSHFQSNRCVG